MLHLLKSNNDANTKKPQSRFDNTSNPSKGFKKFVSSHGGHENG